MYYFGVFLGKLWKYKFYILLTAVYWKVMTVLESWLHFDVSLSIFFMLLYIWWLFMEVRTKKLYDERFFTASIRYIRWYFQNFRYFVKGER